MISTTDALGSLTCSTLARTDFSIRIVSDIMRERERETDRQRQRVFKIKNSRSILRKLRCIDVLDKLRAEVSEINSG